MKQKYTLDSIGDIKIEYKKPSLVFLYGDLGSGKTTFTQANIQKILGDKVVVTSPTYVYYNTYDDIYHFDLYRMSDYDEFVSIGGEEILDNNTGIIFVEWPNILETYYTADIIITFEKKSGAENQREITIEYV